MLKEFNLRLLTWNVVVVEEHRAISAVPYFTEPAKDMLQPKTISKIIFIRDVIRHLVMHIPI